MRHNRKRGRIKSSEETKPLHDRLNKIVKTINKKVRNAKITEVDGIKFRSSLEAFTYRKLKENGIKTFNYESDKFTLIESFKYPNQSYELASNSVFEDVSGSIRAITYTPDFVCIGKDKKGWIIEVKGFANDAFPLRWKMFKKHLMDNGYDVTLFKPNNQGNVLKCIEIIKEKYYDNTSIDNSNDSDIWP